MILSEVNDFEIKHNEIALLSWKNEEKISLSHLIRHSRNKMADFVKEVEKTICNI